MKSLPHADPTSGLPDSRTSGLLGEIEITRLEKTYENGFQAVKGIDLRIAEGEFMVLVGPSGCGKTTTLRMIAGLEQPTGGTISLGGRRIDQLDPKDRDIAMVFQSYALYPQMTVRENLGYALRLRGRAKADIAAAVDEVARLLSLTAELERLPAQLSGGQRQRVALGRAIVRHPKAFLFDEPLSNLDAKLRGEMRVELRRLQRRLGTTAVYVTHDQVEAMTLGDRITVMSGGRIRQVGTPLDCYDRPADRFVAGFLGTPPMNLLTGRLERAGDGFAFRSGAATIAVAGAPAAWAAQVGAEAVLGIRPEHLAIAAGSDGDPAVELVEHLGDRQLVHLAWSDGTAIIAQAAHDERIAIGTRLRIAPNPGAAHLFGGTGDEAPAVR